jgi:diguanylate cyclase (GGDEF)-like protein
MAQLVGRGSDDLRDIRFIDLIEPLDSNDESLKHLEQLFSNPLHRLEHEAALTCHDGTTRHIVWVHTRLGREHHNGVAILSVGLDATDRIQAESRIRWLANHDPLTGLANRLRFREELERSFAEASRSGVPTALLLFDLDHFKDVNDTSGHAAGDALLCLLANELRARARKSDILARLGGDEFAVLMTGANREGAEGFASALNQRLTERLFHFGDRSHRISASIGIALIPEHGKDVEEVMANADAAMYQAKKNGRGQWHLFSPLEEERAIVGNRAYWRSVIAQSLAENRLFFHYQPIIHVPTGQIAYHEALLRVRLEDGRLALPGEYMEVILRSDLMHAIDSFVTEEALRVLANNESMRLSINLSAAALNDASWVQPLREAVRIGVLAPSRLLFEITETAAIADLDTAKELMDELSGLGFGFALDDFGTGFASYHYLKQLPIKHVKIDRSFVSKLANDEGDRVFVTALTTLAHGYRQQVVAEGVEDAATLAVLKDLGVDMAQGFFIGHPGAYPDEKGLGITLNRPTATCSQYS